MKAVMYHYVRPLQDELPYFRYLHVDDFTAQLDYFQANYRILGIDDLMAAVQGMSPPEQGILLTFDDGFHDHYEFVLPELERRGLHGFFYVATGPLSDGRMLGVHRIHHLLGLLGGLAVRDALHGHLLPEMLDEARIGEFESSTYRQQDNDDATTMVKRTLNYYLRPEWREALLDRLSSELADERVLPREFYLTGPQIAEMQRRGMVIGSHGVTHSALATLPFVRQREEIEQSFADLDAVTGGLQLRSFCYPYGGKGTFTAQSERLLAEYGCRFAFAVDPRPITSDDLHRRPLALPRFDCNMFPFGKASLGSQRAAQ